MGILYLLLSTILLLLHSIFFLRPVILKNRVFRPKTIDKVSKNISIILLLPTIIIGTITITSIFWSLIIWMPIILIVTAQFMRPKIKNNPYVLPFLNLIFILLMVILAFTELLWH